MKCELCQKRLSRKTARQIEGVVMCSSCMFAPRQSGETRRAETVGLGAKHEHAVTPKAADAQTPGHSKEHP